MSNEVKKGLSFVKQVVARLKGDDAEVKAQKIARVAISAFEGQIAALNAKQVDLESAVEEGQEALNSAMFPTELITDRQLYIERIKNAQEALDDSKEDLENVKESLAYYEAILAKF